MTSKSFMRLEETWKNEHLTAYIPPSPKSRIYADLPRFFSGVVSQSYLSSPQLQSSFCPQIKLNSQVSCCAFFLSQQLEGGKDPAKETERAGGNQWVSRKTRNVWSWRLCKGRSSDNYFLVRWLCNKGKSFAQRVLCTEWPGSPIFQKPLLAAW